MAEKHWLKKERWLENMIWGKEQATTSFTTDSSLGITTACNNPKWEPTVQGYHTIPLVLEGTVLRKDK